MKLTYPLARLRRIAHDLRARVRYEADLRINASASTPGPMPLVIVLDGLFPFANPGKIVRTADAFGAREVHIVGMRFFDPASSVGTLKRMPLRFFDDLAASNAALRAEGYTVYCLAPPGPSGEPEFLGESTMPERTAIVVGNESWGLSIEPELLPGARRLTIRQRGIVQSLNASVAASIAIYEYDRQRRASAGQGA